MGHSRGTAGGPGGEAESATIARVRALVSESRAVVALTGAGISTDSGIPDFRGPRGIWTKDPSAERLSKLDTYLSDPEVRRASWQSRLCSPAWRARPNAGHEALVSLERAGRLDTLVTQNIDGLHQRAGSDPAKVVELHGTMHQAQCWRCGHRQPMPEVLGRVRSGEDDPRCLEILDGGSACGGILKSATISFGQSLDPTVVARAEAASSSCDLLVAVGSSLVVFPAAGLVPLAHRCGARVVVVNAEPTQYDALAAAVLRGSISSVLPAIFESV